MDSLVIQKILNKYGLDYTRILEPQKGYRNSSYAVRLKNGEWINLIIYKSEPGILDKINTANSVSKFLHTNKFPVRHQIDSRVLKLRSESTTKYACLYNYLHGNTIAWEAYTKEHIKNLGGMMAQVHKSLARAPHRNIQLVTQEYTPILKRMIRYFENPQVMAAVHHKLDLEIDIKQLEKYIKILRICDKLPDQQALHMDFVRGNILFEGSKISGILDFEKAGSGIKLLDIARTLAFLLVDCKYKDELKVRKYFLQSGYVKRGGIEFKNVVIRHGGIKTDLLEELLNMFLMYDFYKFLRHNPYEFLEQNEHYIRTRGYLLKRGVITTSQHAI